MPRISASPDGANAQGGTMDGAWTRPARWVTDYRACVHDKSQSKTLMPAKV